MTVKNSYRSILLTNKPYLQFFFSQGVSSFGDTFQIVAITVLIFHLTGSGMFAGFGLLLYPVSSLLLSPFAGGLSDILPEKKMLIIIDVLRGVVAVLFIWSHHILAIYTLLFILSFLNVIYGPPSRKIIAVLLKNEEVIAGNSLLSGVSGVSFLIGPVLAGFMIDHFGGTHAFIINAISFLYSALQIMFIKTKAFDKKIIHTHKKHQVKKIFSEMKKGMKYFLDSKPIIELSVTTAMICFVYASINFAFYPYAFDILKVTSKGWGFMLSVMYGANVIALFVSMLFDKIINRSLNFFIYLQLLVIAYCWFNYGITYDLSKVILFQIVEGTASALLWIFLVSKLQLITRKSYMGRVAGLNDIVNNFGKLIGIGGAFIVLRFSNTETVFILNAMILLLFVLVKQFSPLVWGKKR